ncbi:MAG: DUF294 nucleotidyltransferase-like domain-containing protein [Bacteroidetes bacterium]|jgi:PAS domain S-box-containing protein|nr:DUF294 nucleotidyltransferase-like domain-containing protein [Bacteroidota bacterium]
MKTFYLKIIVPTVLAVLLFLLTFFLVIVPRFQQQMMQGKQEMIKELTNSAWSILAKYEKNESDGLMSREEAQQTAINNIQNLRYGDENKDYFWVTDMHPNMIMHPFRSDLNGQDLSDFTDPHGNRMFVDFVETVKMHEHGFVNYMWQWKDDSLHIVPKLSYVKLFKPWNWIIGTGIYIEDVQKEMRALTSRMLWISITISFIIALILFYIIKQSLNIENKRIAAEEELQHAKEKYFTLIEAATEGLVMLIDGRISFANAVISRMSGYAPHELEGLSFNDIISKNNNQDILKAFSENHVKPGTFELNLRKKNGGSAEVLITSSTAVFYGKPVNIIIVKDISIEKTVGFTTVDYQQLINSLDMGFFKARIDSKGKVIFANETAIKIFGFSHLDELSDCDMFDLVVDADDRKNIRLALNEEGYLKNKVIQIRKTDQTIATVAISLIALSSEANEGQLCDGIIEDISRQEQDREKQNEIITALKANELVLEQAVSGFLAPLYTLPESSQLKDVIDFLARKKTDCVLLFNRQNDYVGIITNSDIQQRILRLNLKLDNPAYLIMSAPIVFADAQMSVFEGIRLCEENDLSHLPVKSADGNIAGVFQKEKFGHQVSGAMPFLLSKVKAAETIEDLKLAYEQLLYFIKPLIKSELSVKYLTKITSQFFDAALARIVELCMDEIGPAPASFSFICMGSEGRKEETLLTDQDNAIIYADVAKEKEEMVKTYFLKLGSAVCEALDTIGYRYCKGNIMAMNPQWCVSLSGWKKYFAQWIASPEPQHLLDAMIFFDFRKVVGDESLCVDLRKTIDHAIQQYPTFLYHLAYNTYYTKPQQIASNILMQDKSNETIDLKSAMAPIIMLARTYAFQHQIMQTNTRERLLVLKEKQIIKEPTIDEILYTYDYLMKLRFNNQLLLLEQKMTVTNILAIKRYNELEKHSLKRKLAAVQDFQQKVKLDFRVTT